MNIDLHLHSVFSYQGELGKGVSDASLLLEDIPRLAQHYGLDGVVVTDHMTMEAGEEAFRRVQEAHPDFLLLRGMEYHSDHGHLLLFGIRNDDVCRRFGKYGHAPDVIRFVNDLGGAVVPSHPYRESCHYTMGDRVFGLSGLVALEAINGDLYDMTNERARQATQRLSLPGVGGSDAHEDIAIGTAYTHFLEEIRSMQDLVRALRDGGVRAVKNRSHPLYIARSKSLS